jgi:two-component system phosphate regulon sensor histidine kinase PhoR
MIEMFVRDSGAGIAPEDLPRVFERFYRSNGEVSGSGSGLGLAIAREIVRAHGGEMRVESKAGVGTSFAFTLPAAPAARRTTHSALPDAARDAARAET